MRWVWAAAALLLVAVAACGLYAHLLKTRTESLINSAYELSNRPADADGLPFAVVRARYGEELRKLPNCTPDGCAYEVALTNRVFSFLHVLPYTELRSQFWVRDGMVFENMLDYQTAIDRRTNVVAHAAIQYCNDCTTFYLHPWGDSSPLDTNGFVSIGSASISAKKRMVLSLNPACMTKLDGCASVAELLPTVWERTGNAIRCRIPNKEGMVDAPPGWWWLK